MKMFICDDCGGEFEEGGATEEEKLDELKKNFGNFSIKDCGRVCDDCYDKIRRRIYNEN